MNPLLSTSGSVTRFTAGWWRTGASTGNGAEETETARDNIKDEDRAPTTTGRRRAVDKLLAPFLQESGKKKEDTTPPSSTTPPTANLLPEQVERWKSSASATATRAGEVVEEWKTQTSNWITKSWQPSSSRDKKNGSTAKEDTTSKGNAYRLLPLPTDQINWYRTQKSDDKNNEKKAQGESDEEEDKDQKEGTAGTLQDWVRINIMGCFSSKPAVLQECDGNDTDFHKRYVEGKVLGEGEFAVVKLAHDTQSSSDKQVAVKKLRKGIQFKDNTFYSPIKPEALREECHILRALSNDDQHFVLQLLGIYESSSAIWIVTEFCEGGEMMPWVSKNVTHLTTHLVARISYQLLTALDHCGSHNVLHRDIKPQNVMFLSNNEESDLRLIDFGFGCIDPPKHKSEGGEVNYHTTFAGTAFYIAPEVFQKKYTSKLDVWSVGVTLYVLVAGYPANELQKAFNILQKSKRDLRTLPNVPTNDEEGGEGGLPDSYWDMLDQLLTYSAKKRPTAGSVLQTSEFLREARESAAPATKTRPPLTSATSTRIIGSVGRHTAYLEYGKFELAVTTLLASFLSRDQLMQLLQSLDEQVWLSSQVPREEEEEEDFDESNHSVLPEKALTASQVSSTPGAGAAAPPQTHLQIISIRELQALVQQMGFEEAATKITQVKNYSSYGGFAYHVSLLRQFVATGTTTKGGSGSYRPGGTLSGGSLRSTSDRPRQRLARTTSFAKDNTNTLSGSTRKMRRSVSGQDLPSRLQTSGSFRRGGK